MGKTKILIYRCTELLTILYKDYVSQMYRMIGTHKYVDEQKLLL